MRFAFYGRVSTEDQQDPTSSRNWQLSRGRQLIEPTAGEIVGEFFDIGQSRSLPWPRRPEAARLLKALADHDRGFRRGRDRRTATRVLRQPVRAHVPGVRALRRAALGARGRRSGRSRQRRPRDRHVALRRHEQRRTQPHQDPRRTRDGSPSRDRGTLPRRPTRRSDTASPTPARIPTRARRTTAVASIASNPTR